MITETGRARTLSQDRRPATARRWLRGVYGGAAGAEVGSPDTERFMAKSIYVGNLPFETTDEELAQLFRPFGTVSSGEVILDRFSGRSRGFGLVEMPSDDEAEDAIRALNGHSQGGRRLVVNEARPPAGPPPLEFGLGGRNGGPGRAGRGHRKRDDRDPDRREPDEE